MKKRYYRLNKILGYKAHYNILLGMRSNGKSYAVKEFVLLNAYHGKGKFIYMRRYREDVKTNDVISYFSDMPIESITQGKYQGVTCYQGVLYFCNYTDELRTVKGEEIGRVVYLSGMEHFKSQAFPDITDVIFEEFVTKRLYLRDEPNTLQNFISTIARDRNIRVWMVANTISRVCPYFEEWALKNIPRQKQGTIDTYKYDRHAEDGTVYTTVVAVENCENAGTSSNMFFGNIAKSITGGQWEVEEVPHLPVDEEGRELPYECLYEIHLSDMGFQFVLQLCCNDEGGMWIYVYPYTKTKRILRHITSEFSTDPFYSVGLMDKIPAEAKMRELLKEQKICYSDNLTGSDFNSVIQNRGGTL